MASVSQWTPFGVALNLTATAGTVTRTSATQFTVSLTAKWNTHWPDARTTYGMKASSGGKTVTISAFTGDRRSSGSTTFTGTYSIDGNGSSSKTISVTFTNFNDDNGDSASKTVNITVKVPAWTSYTIMYNANGGSGAPGSQTKWKNQTLILSSVQPTRTGYGFLGWATSASATTAKYSAGATIAASELNANTTLYAVWGINVYAVKYDAAGGTGAPASQIKTYNKSLKLSDAVPTKTDYTFAGWSTNALSKTVTYHPGDNYSLNQSITLYAVWEKSYVKPTITNLVVRRCGEDGTLNDDGSHIFVKFDWTTTYNSKIDIDIIDSSGKVFTHPLPTYPDTIPITSGTVEEIVGGNGVTLSTEETYTVHVIVSDSGGSYDRSVTVASERYTIDFLAGGNGVAFGKTAKKEGYADFGFEVCMDNELRIAGRDLEGNIVEAFQPINENGNTVIGWGNYNKGSGNTNIYGHDVLIGVSNIPTPLTFRPYYRAGDSVSLTIDTSGYITNGKKDLHFFIPLSKPVIGKPTIALSSINGFTVRQWDSYLYGSSGSASTHADSISAWLYNGVGVLVKATFSNITDVINNTAVGVQWNGTITFS